MRKPVSVQRHADKNRAVTQKDRYFNWLNQSTMLSFNRLELPFCFCMDVTHALIDHVASGLYCFSASVRLIDLITFMDAVIDR